jgi:hypothetical protein
MSGPPRTKDEWILWADARIRALAHDVAMWSKNWETEARLREKAEAALAAADDLLNVRFNAEYDGWRVQTRIDWLTAVAFHLKRAAGREAIEGTPPDEILQDQKDALEKVFGAAAKPAARTPGGAPPTGSSPTPRPFDQRTEEEKIEDAIKARRHAESQECGT